VLLALRAFRLCEAETHLELFSFLAKSNGPEHRHYIPLHPCSAPAGDIGLIWNNLLNR